MNKHNPKPERINDVKPSAAFPLSQMPRSLHSMGYLSAKGAIKYSVSPCEMREMSPEEFQEKSLRHHTRSKIEVLDGECNAPHIVAALWNYAAFVEIMMKYDPDHIEWFKTTDFFTS